MPQVSDINQVGKREDLSDILVVADAKATPYTSMMKKGKKPANVKYSWPHKRIPDPDTTPIPDGKPVDNTEDLSGQRAILEGRVHKLRRVIGVSELAEDVNTPAGVQSEFAESKANGLLAVKRAIEAMFLGDQDSLRVGAVNQCRGLGSWINNSAQADLPVDPLYRTPTGNIWTGTLTALLEDDVRGVMQSIFEQIGEMLDHDGFVGTNVQAQLTKMTIHDPNVSGKTVVRTFFTQLTDATLLAKVDIIKGDFGIVRLIPTLWLNWNNTTKTPDKNRGYIVKTDGVSMRANKMPGFKPLPEDDSGPKGVISAIISQQVDSPLVHGKIGGS